jgi:hypothetical protein
MNDTNSQKSSDQHNKKGRNEVAAQFYPSENERYSNIQQDNTFNLSDDQSKEIVSKGRLNTNSRNYNLLKQVRGVVIRPNLLVDHKEKIAVEDIFDDDDSLRAQKNIREKKVFNNLGSIDRNIFSPLVGDRDESQKRYSIPPEKKELIRRKKRQSRNQGKRNLVINPHNLNEQKHQFIIAKKVEGSIENEDDEYEDEDEHEKRPPVKGGGQQKQPEVRYSKRKSKNKKTSSKRRRVRKINLLGSKGQSIAKIIHKEKNLNEKSSNRNDDSSSQTQNDVTESTTEEDDVVGPLIKMTYKKYKKYFDNNQEEDNSGLASVKALVTGLYDDYQNDQDLENTRDEDSNHAKERFNKYFKSKINDVGEDNKKSNIIKAIIDEKKKSYDSKKYDDYKSQYIEEYDNDFKVHDNHDIDMGLKIIAANKLTKELVKNRRIHPAHKVPMDDDEEFTEYIKKHFKRFLIQMKKNPKDIKTNGELHTFVYYRGPFLDNLLKNVHNICQNNNEDFKKKCDMINENLNNMAKEYSLKDKMENFLGGTLDDVLGEKIDKLPEYQDQNSTIYKDSQSSQNGFQDTDSQSNESNLSRGGGSQQNDSSYYKEMDSQATVKEFLKVLNIDMLNASENVFEDFNEHNSDTNIKLQQYKHHKMPLNQRNNPKTRLSDSDGGYIGEEGDAQSKFPQYLERNGGFVNQQNTKFQPNQRKLEGRHRIFPMRTYHNSRGVSSQERETEKQ